MEQTPLEPPPEPEVRLFDSGHAARHGFVRIINHSESGGEVRIVAIDAAGVESDDVALTIGLGEARHLNSEDLVRGNPDKGLGAGIGAGFGDARLELSSDLDIESLSYARTATGFVTALHDAVVAEAGGVYRLLFFNPGGNLDQVSRLRLVNEGPADARATVTGVDDAGASSGEVGIEVPAGATVDFTAAELESGAGVDGSLGAGTGKWRLTVRSARPLTVLNLLESPTGHVSNLSTAPRLRGSRQGSLAVPLFPSAADATDRRGFVRVVNRSSSAGDVVISARDDTSWEYEPLTLRLAAGAAAHFNSDDLELGNEQKGLTGSTGAGEGAWRLEMESDLEIEVLSYIRTADGFVAPVHDVLPADDGVYRAAYFNPGSNEEQVSALRLVNFTGEAATVKITATDDDGRRPGATVRLNVAALSAAELTAAELESGNAPEIRSGAFGDGRGKWRVRVESDVPMHVMSLLSSPGQYLTNVSTASPSRGFERTPADVLDPPATVSLSSPRRFAIDGSWAAVAGARYDVDVLRNRAADDDRSLRRTTRTSYRWSSLGPATYTIRVRSVNEDGALGEWGAESDPVTLE